ncbi:DUF4270 family protein [Olivibacter sp. CPCC 100613]|uniref:DUF4270 family protein n=1 Tax=Olivibacter sp. CPCC 100613 TaxID=3079931 RepID=UPI002FF73FEB
MIRTIPKPKKSKRHFLWLLGMKLMISSLLIFFFMSSCTKEGTISLNNTNDNIGAEIADSITVRTATYQLDPLPANGKGIMLVGEMTDEATGNLKASSYFRIGNSAISSVTLPDDAVFDSISLALPYQGYYYGDTSLTQSFTLHQVTEEIKLIDESNAWEEDEKPVFGSGSTLFTNNTFRYDTNPLGAISFKPKPTSKTDTVFVKLNQMFGEDLWTKVKSGSNQVTNSEEFLEYIKGFVLIPSGKTPALTAFPTDSILMNIYYSYTRTADGKKVQENLQMKVDDTTHQFNSLQIDRSQSLLSALKPDAEGELSSDQTKQQVMLQGLSGLVTKIQFPYLHEFVNRNDVIINKAELTIETPPSSHTPYTAPSTLNIMLADEHGVPKSLLTASYETTTQAAYLVNDLSGGTRNSTYTFNLTEYVSNYRGAMEDTKSSLYLTIPVSDLLTKADRLLIAKSDDSLPIKLRILYTKY